MKITKAILCADNIEKMRGFYIEVLGFNLVNETETSFEIQVGTSLLGFELEQLEEKKQYHFAFNIPGNLFIEAKEWIKMHTSLLVHREKDDIYFESINAHSIYFHDPEENVVELIARHALNPAKNVQHFTARDILDIAEMNLTTSNVLEVGEKLEEIGVFERHHLSLEESTLNFLGEPEDGTHLLLGPNGRNWFFSTKKAMTSPITIELNNQHRIQLDTQGHSIMKCFRNKCIPSMLGGREMIKGLYEAHLPVSNLLESIEFYKSLGLEVAFQNEKLVFFWIEKGYSWLGLWETDKVETPYHPSLRHIAFQVEIEDIKNAKEWLEAKGIAIRAAFGFSSENQPLVLPNFPQSHAAIYFHDPDGNSLELITPLKIDFEERFEMMSLKEWNSKSMEDKDRTKKSTRPEKKA